MKCPGQDTQFWTAEAIFEASCPKCNAVVEFFKDDTTRKCGNCGHRFVNPKMDFGCAAYCSYAEQCLGDLPPELVAQKEDLFKDRVAVAVKRHLKSDFNRIGRAVRRARHVEAMAGAGEINLAAVLMAAYLWDLVEADSDSPTGTVRTLLQDLKAPEPLVEKVCGLLEGAAADTRDGRAAADAAAIALLEDELKNNALTKEAIRDRAAGCCTTQAGKEYALRLLGGE